MRSPTAERQDVTPASQVYFGSKREFRLALAKRCFDCAYG
jgi:hypothetical protein